jgi:CO/xanthine dehydrogenase FAD-binding subunit
MKFPSFSYCAPGSLQEAIGILADDPEARPVAGGQSLAIIGIQACLSFQTG